MREIIFFYGADCPHCKRMRPIVAKLKDELKCNITSLEVWDNEENADKMRKYEDLISKAGDGFMGVPAFVDVKNKQAKCGEMSEEELKKWLIAK